MSDDDSLRPWQKFGPAPPRPDPIPEEPPYVEPMVTMNVQVPRALRQRFKETAVRINTPMRALLIRAMEEMLVKYPPNAQQPPEPILAPRETWGTR